MPSPLITGLVLLVTNLILCLAGLSLSADSYIAAVAAALAATTVSTLGKRHIPTQFLWPVTALSVVTQTFATSSLLSVQVTVVISPIMSLVQGFLAIPL